jgi:Leucine-rich repeat (LRR) protein
MKQYELKQLIKETILAELEPAPPSQIYGITVDGEKVKFKLDENSILDCSYKNLKTLIVNDSQIIQIYCGDNQLTTLRLGRLPNLEELYCYSNQLTTLDVSKCPKLEYLNCNSNKLTSLNISKCPNLTFLDCKVNKLISLDISKCLKLKKLYYDKDKIKLIR